MGGLADADAVAEVVRRLKASALIATPPLVGPGSVSGEIEGPWPHVVVGPSGIGDLRGGNGASIATGVTVSVISGPDGSVGKAELWRVMLDITQLIFGFPDDPYTPGATVVCEVTSDGFITYQPLTSGQHRFEAPFVVVTAPPQPALS